MPNINNPRPHGNGLPRAASEGAKRKGSGWMLWVFIAVVLGALMVDAGGPSQFVNKAANHTAQFAKDPTGFAQEVYGRHQAEQAQAELNVAKCIQAEGDPISCRKAFNPQFYDESN